MWRGYKAIPKPQEFYRTMTVPQVLKIPGSATVYQESNTCGIDLHNMQEIVNMWI